MKMRDKISMLFNMMQRQKIMDMFARKQGKKAPQLMFSASSPNYGPVGSGKSKTFKKKKRAQAQYLARGHA